MTSLERARGKLADDKRQEREVTKAAAELQSLRWALAAGRERTGEQAKREQALARTRLADCLGKISERIDPFANYCALPVERTWVLFSDPERLERGRSAAQRCGLRVGRRSDIRRVRGRDLTKYVPSVAFVDPSPTELATLAP